MHKTKTWKWRFLSMTMFALLAVVAAFTECREDKPDDVVKDNEIKLVKPDNEASFDLSEVAKITFKWTEVEAVSKYTLRFSPNEAGLSTTDFTINARVNTSYDLPSAAADVLLGKYTDADYEKGIDLYWTVTGDAGGVKTQVRKISIKRMPEGRRFEILGDKEFVFDAAPAGAETVEVVSNINWTVTSSASWLTVDPASGSGNATINITAAQNIGRERTATVTIRGEDIAEPVILNITQTRATVSGGTLAPVPDPVYFNNFERGLEGATITGSGSLTDFGGNFGTVFQNVGGAQRTNYLLLPDDVLAHSATTKALTVSFWVNSANAGASGDYAWAPLFMAYGSPPSGNSNTWPMLACQYRGVVQVNHNGWCDYTDPQNDAGSNELHHFDNDWLADKQWHLYTAVFTETSAVVYFDDEVANSWTISGSGDGNSVGTLFTDNQLKYVCLGGNQAWNWGDNDPGFMFDDVAIYNVALTAEQVRTVIESKKIPSPVYFNNFERGLGETSIVGSGTLDIAGGNFGTVFQNTGGAQRTNYLLLPDDVLTHSATTKALTVSFWVNSANAGASGDYAWAPLFMAYGSPPSGNSNTWPMLACQYRGLVQVNHNGWCDYTDPQNDAGKNDLYHFDTDWLADKQWHLYTAVFTETSAVVYYDGEVANSWTISGSGDGNSVGTLFTDNQLKYVCLGGNQAWNWGDNDPGFMFDDVAIYNVALTAEQINILSQQKKLN